MEMSVTIGKLAEAMSKMQGSLRSVSKTSVNPFFKSKYADLDAVWDVCRIPLTNNGLAVIQTTSEVDNKTVLETILVHTSGEWIKGSLDIKPAKQDPQGIGSAITYARRYALSAILGISADENDDAESATRRDAQKPARTQDKPLHAESVQPKQNTPPVQSQVATNPIQSESDKAFDALESASKASKDELASLARAMNMFGYDKESIKPVLDELGVPLKSTELTSKDVEKIINRLTPEELKSVK